MRLSVVGWVGLLVFGCGGRSSSQAEEGSGGSTLNAVQGGSPSVAIGGSAGEGVLHEGGASSSGAGGSAESMGGAISMGGSMGGALSSAGGSLVELGGAPPVSGGSPTQGGANAQGGVNAQGGGMCVAEPFKAQAYDPKCEDLAALVVEDLRLDGAAVPGKTVMIRAAVRETSGKQVLATTPGVHFEVDREDFGFKSPDFWWFGINGCGISKCGVELRLPSNAEPGTIARLKASVAGQKLECPNTHFQEIEFEVQSEQ